MTFIEIKDKWQERANIAHTVSVNGKAGEKLKGAWGRGRAAYRTFAAHRATTIAGTLVFFLIMSLVPFLFWVTLLFGGAEGMLDKVLELELFEWARDLLTFLRNNAQGATTGASIFLLATTLWSSSAFFYHLRRSGEIIYHEEFARKGLRVRLLAILMTFAVLLLFAVSGGILVFLSFVTRPLSRWIAYPFLYAALLAVGFFAAWLLNVYVCPHVQRAKAFALGSFLTALAWLLASAVFSVYLSFGNQEKLYGALTLVIVFLLWLYWLMICFVAGVIFNKHRIFAKSRTRPMILTGSQKL